MTGIKFHGSFGYKAYIIIVMYLKKVVGGDYGIFTSNCCEDSSLLELDSFTFDFALFFMLNDNKPSKDGYFLLMLHFISLFTFRLILWLGLARSQAGSQVIESSVC